MNTVKECPHCGRCAYASVSCPCGRTQQTVPDPPSAAEKERATIVKWLRDKDTDHGFVYDESGVDVEATLDAFADAIERGDHLK